MELTRQAQKELPEAIRAIQGSIPQGMLGWLRETPADTPIEEIRHRLFQDEYVFVKGLLPRNDVLEARDHYFSQFESLGLLKPGTAPVDGIYSGEDPALHNGIGGGEPAAKDELRRLVGAHVQQPYLDFVAHPKLRGMVRDLMQWEQEVLVKRTMLRHNIPGGQSTGIHYDKLFLRGGDAFFLTAWVPIGDTKATGGGLVYLEDSTGLGNAIEDDFSTRAKDFTTEEKVSAFNRNMTATGVLSTDPMIFQQDNEHLAKKRRFRWLVADYEAGDVVFHLPYTIHTAAANADPNGHIRLSTDLRFYSKRDADQGSIDSRWDKFWTPSDGL
jgi:phytanoyl-CoA hydroxylase